MTDEKRRKHSDQTFADEAGNLLREANEQLDAATVSRLNQARQSAIAQLEPPRAAFDNRWIPVGALAASVLVATALWLGHEPETPESNPFAETMADQMEDLDILMSDEDFELYDDLEFFSWLGSELDALDDESGQG